MGEWRVALIHSRPDGDDVVYTTCYQDVGASGSPVGFIEAIGDAYIDFLDDTQNIGSTGAPKADLAEGVTFYRATIRSLPLAPGGNIWDYLPTPHASTSTTSLPAQVAAVITKRSNLNSRRGRGRMFFGPLSAASATWSDTTNQWGNNFQARIAGKWAANMQSIAFGGGTLEEQVWSSVNGVGYPIISYAIDSRPDTQRRRL